jgi:RHS repeat-associated protein
MRRRLVVAAVLTLSLVAQLSGTLAPANAAALRGGTIDATFETNAFGSATYSIPIIVPPGTNGVQPDLAITYDSQSGDGTLGVGFSLVGVSSIQRCPANVVDDSYNGSVAFTGSDRFCLDNQRLMRIAGQGSYGAPGTRYHTQLETWIDVTAIGTCGSGPCSFTARTKQGWTVRYGETLNSQLTLEGRPEIGAWFVTSVTDLNGNTVDFSYEKLQADHQLLPSRIRYTRNDAAGLVAQREIAFAYQPRSDVTPRFRGGYRFAASRILTSIDTTRDGQDVLHYLLAYRASDSTDRLLLRSIQLCGPHECLAPTTFGWSDSALRLISPNGNAKGIVRERWCEGGEVNWGDFRGDARASAICFMPNGDAYALVSDARVLVSPNANANGLLRAAWCPTDAAVATVANFDGDRRSDLACTLDNGDERALLSNGTSVVSPNETHEGSVARQWCPKSTRDSVAWLNFQAEGRDGVACSDNRGDQFVLVPDRDARQLISPNTSPRGLVATGLCRNASTLRAWSPYQGNGMADFYCATTSGDQSVMVSTGTILRSPNSSATGFLRARWCSPPDALGFADLNGDGLQDTVCARSDGSIDLLLSTGSQLSTPNGDANGRLVSRWCTGPGAHVTWADLNGDGRQDVMCLMPDGTLKALLSTGTGLVSPRSGQVLASRWCPGASVFGAIDFVGGGLADPACITGGTIQVLVHQNIDADRVTTITNGLNAHTTIAYAPMSDPRIYTRAATSTYPDIAVESPIVVVSSYTIGDGLGAAYRSTLAYRGARTDVRRDVWLGFESIAVTEVATGRTHVMSYAQRFPTITTVTAVDTWSGIPEKSRRLESEHYDWQTSERPGHVYVVDLQQESYEMFGSAGLLYRTGLAYRYDTFGNVTINYPLYVDQVKDRSFTCRVYANDSSSAAWRLGYNLAVRVTRTEEGCERFLRQPEAAWDANVDLFWKTYTFDDRMRAIAESTWDDRNAIFLKIGYTFDPFGNRVTMTNPAGYRSDIDYDAQYRTFVVRQLLPQVNGRRVTLSYSNEPNFGQVTTQSDANGNVTRYVYDDFGRPTQQWEPTPNGASGDPAVCTTVMSYERASAGYTVHEWDRPDWSSSNDPHTWLSTRTRFDGLERTVESVESGAAPALEIVSQTQYDASGRAYRSSIPRYAGDAISWVTLSFDDYDRVLRMTRPDGTVEVHEYLDGDRMTRTIDAFGTPDARMMTVTTDRAGDVVKRSTTAGTTSFTYDPIGRLLDEEGPGGVKTTQSFDSIGRVTASNDPDRGVSVMTYGTDGRLHAMSIGNGTRYAFTWDALDRLVQRTATKDDGQTRVARYSYDDPSVSNGQGNLTGIETDDMRESFAYSRDELLARETLRYRGTDYTEQHEWSPAGAPTLTVFPDGARQETTYDALGNVRALALSTDGGTTYKPYATYTDYTALVQPRRVDYGNGIAERLDYWPIDQRLGQLRDVQFVSHDGTALLASTAYTYNADHQVSRREFAANPIGTRNWTYTYTSDGWIKTYGGNAGSGSFEYDGAGNLTQKSGVTYKMHSGTNRLATGSDAATFAYDGVGNMIEQSRAGTTTHYTYDPEGDLRKVERDGKDVLEATYDDDDQRLEKRDLEAGDDVIYVASNYEVYHLNGQTFATKYIEDPGGTRVAAVTSTVTAARDAIFVVPVSFVSLGMLLLGLIARLRRRALLAVVLIATVAAGALPQPALAQLGPGDGNPPLGTQYYGVDALGSTLLVTDGGGARVAVLDYEPYGSIGAAAGPNAFRPKFAGKEHDSAARLEYFGDRYFDAQLGRFIQPDPFDAFTSPYSYATDDPLNVLEASGDFPIVALLVGAAIGFVAGAYAGGVAGTGEADPTQWNWNNGALYSYLFAGAGIGAVGGVLGGLVSAASPAFAIIGGAVLGAAEGAAFTALGNGGPSDYALAVGAGAALGALGGVLDAAGSVASVADDVVGAGAKPLGGALARRSAREADDVLEAGSDIQYRFGPCGIADDSGVHGSKTATVWTPSGTVPIDQLRPGDLVWSRDEKTKTLVREPVLATTTYDQTSIVHLAFAAGAPLDLGPAERVEKSDGTWIDATNVRPGDTLKRDRDSVAVRSVTVVHRTQSTSQIEVAETHTYFVTGAHLLLHNPAQGKTCPLVANGDIKATMKNKRLQRIQANLAKKYLRTGTGTTVGTRKYVRSRGFANDDAGHPIARRLGGPGHMNDYIFPQVPRINRGIFRMFEGEVAELVEKHGFAQVTLEFFYKGKSARPYKIVYTANFTKTKTTFSSYKKPVTTRSQTFGNN